MSRRSIRPLRDAQDELVAAIEWYESQRPGLGREFWDDVQRAVKLIGSNPSAGGVVRSRVTGIRRIPLRRFPYFIFYLNTLLKFKSSRLRT